MFDAAGAATGVEAAQDAAAQAEAEAAVTDSHSGHTDSSELDIVTAVDPTQNNPAADIVVVDTSVAGYEDLIQDLAPGTEVILLDGQDGIDALAARLEGRSNIGSLHVISHGDTGLLSLGADTLTSDNLDDYSASLTTIGNAMSENGDILLYGCLVGEGGEGQAFIDQIAALTGADIAASNDITGAEALGGDWDLEVVTGSIESGMPFSERALTNFTGTLPFSGTITFSTVINEGGFGGSYDYGTGKGDGSDNASFGDAGGYTLVADGANYNTGAFYGYGYSSENESSMTLYFSNGETFTPTSLYVYNSNGLNNDTFIITSNTGGSTQVTLDGNAGESATVDLTGLTGGATSITITVQDGDGFFYVDDFVVSNVAGAANNAPTVSNAPTDVTVTEDVASNLDLSSVTLADVDGDNLTVTLAASAGTMTASSGGGVTVGGSGTGSLTLSGSAANINTYLDTTSNIRYTSASNANGDNAATLTITPNDGTVNGTAATVNIDITAVNDSPTLSGLGNLSYTEGDSATIIDSDVTFSDPDGYDGATLVVSGLLSEDTVSVNNQGTDSGQIGFDGTNVTYEGVTIGTASGGSGATLTITFNASAGQTAVDALIQNLTYANSSNVPTASRALSISFTDNQSASLVAAVSWSRLTDDNNPLNGLGGSFPYSNTAVVDIDNDGDLDIFSGKSDGTFHFLRNDGTSTSPSFVEYASNSGTNPLTGLDAGTYSAPTFVDIDDDGDYDLFVGRSSNGILLYRNNGTAESPSFVLDSDTNPLSSITYGGNFADLKFVDIDGDDDQDVLINASGGIFYFRNDGTASSASFTSVTGGSNPFNAISASGYSAPTLGDFDSDGDYDMLVGAANGAFTYYENQGTSETASFVQQTGSDNPFNGVSIVSLPRSGTGDFDDDGDLEIVGGSSSGTFYWFQNDSNLNSTTITVTAIDDEPTLTATGANPTFTEGGSAATLFTGASASTIEAGQTFSGFTLTVTNLADGSDELLGLDGSSVALTNGANGTTATNSLSFSVAVSGSTATVTVTGGTLSSAEMQTLVEALTYSNSSEDPSTGSSRVVTLTSLTDSGSNSGSNDNVASLSIASTVSLTALNDEPTLTATGANPTFTEGGSAVTLFSGSSVSTIESGQTLAGMTLTVTNLADGSNEILNLDGTAIALTNGTTGTTATNSLSYSVAVSGSTATVTLSGGTLSTAATQTLVDAISYQNSSDDPDTSDRVVTITSLQDSGGTANGGDDTATLVVASTVTATGLNDEPTLTATAANPTFTEGGAAASVFSGSSVSTVEAGQTLSALTLTVTNVNDGSSEVLNVDGTAMVLTNGTSGTTATNSLGYSVAVTGTTATVTLSGGNLSAAATQTLVDAISYQNNSDDPDTSDRVVTITSLQDSGGTANGGDDTAALAVVSTSTVAGVNDNPSASGVPTDVTVTEDTSSNLDLSAISFADPDSSGNVTVTLAVGMGNMSASSGGSVTIGGSGTDTLTLTGTVSNINTYLDTASNIQYTSASNAEGNDATSISVTINDGDGSGDVLVGTINIDITAVNDAPVVSGTFSGAVTEGNPGDAAVTASGTLSISDVDVADTPSFADIASTAGDNGYGGFVLVSGTWTYTLDQSAVQDLDAGDSVTDTITYTATDGTTQQVIVTITGSNDAAVVTGITTGSVTEGNTGDSAVTASGTISISDADADDSPGFADVASTAGDNGYGSFALASGTWTYTLDQSAVQDLDAGDTVTDTITYTATDGTTQQVTVTITGSNDAAVVSGTTTGSVAEGNTGDAAVTAAGTLSISDVDADDTPSFADVASTAGDNSYGSFVLASGTWTYTLDQSAVQNLDAGDSVTDTITYTATDGTTQQITVTITGSNDAAVVTGTTTGSVTEGNVGDNAVTASGTISISDADADDTPSFADVASTAGDNGYGSFALVSGTWTYTLDQSAVQDLDAGDSVTDTITYTATDGTAQQMTLTITGSNDAAVVTGTTTGSVTEGNTGDAAVTASGSLSISDVDADDSPSFADVNSTAGDNGYGSFALASGTWTYTLDQSAVQDLDAGDTVTDTINYMATDGTTQQVTVAITGSNDVPVVSGTFTGNVTEGNVGDAAVTASGTISISDADADDSPGFADVASTPGDNSYGRFVLASGTWTYTLDQNAVQNLDAGDTVTDTITYTATDGTTQQISVTITGANDAAVVSGTTTGSVTEGNVGDAAVTAAGTLSISDVDADDSPSFADVASTAGDNSYGSFVLVSGTWTYTLDQSAVQNLDAGDTVTDTITYTATDGTTQQITLTITGSNDVPVVSGTFTGNVTEGNTGDAAVTASGTISISDADADDTPSFADVASTAGDNSYGSFVLASGTWTYTLDQSAVQNLDAGDSVTDTITYTATDGTTQQVTVTITGSDDAAVVSGTTTGGVTEGNVGDAAVTASGSLSISDVDADDSPSFADVASTAGDNGYGSFALVSGTWTYTLDQSAVQDLDAGDTVTDTHTYTATDGTTQQVTVTITGSNDAAVVTGTTTGNVTEGNVGDNAVTASGTISISDADADDSPGFADVASTAGDNGYGSFALASGTWTYTLDQTAVQDLDAGDTVTDTITYTATDGTTQQVTVTITGSNDAAVVTGNTTGSVTEGNVGDAAVTAAGTLSISDVDADDTPSFADIASTAGDNGYGSFVLASGTWTYTLDQSAVQDLDAGDTVTDTHTYTATDGTTQQVIVTITGSNDAAVVSGTTTGSVTEGNTGDAAVTASGSLSISDVDADDSPSFADVASTAGDNGYGSFVLASGTWTYTLDQSAVQDLDAGDTVTDTITYTATDGTSQQVTVTITGSNDAAVVTGITTGSVTEGNTGDSAVTASGTISISDADADDSPGFADVASTAGDNGYGSFALVSGTWTYTLDQSAVQDLDAGDTVTDTITYTATDGTTQQVTVTITGSNDAAVVTGITTGSVTEGNVGDAAVTASGTISISDADADDTPSFADVASTAGDNGYGSFALVSGTWTYTLDQNAVQNLDAGDTVTDTITYTATDGTTQQISVTITGANDAAVVSGTTTGSVTEGNVGDAAVTAAGTLSISDVDADDSPSFADVASTAGDNSYGSFVLASGTWTYTLDQSAVQNLDAGDTVTDTHTYTATDGTTQQISVTITGANDAAVVSGTTTGNVTEGNTGDSAVTASGTISISDADADDTPSFADVASTAGDNGYGSFALVSGTWTYTLDQSAVQDLDAGDTVTDTITYTATDGTTQQVTVAITGSNDVPVVSGTFTGNVTEGNTGDAAVTAAGTLSISDVDADDTPSFADVASTAGDNSYGSFVLASGTWTYTLDQSAVQDLDAGDTVTDTTTYTATDGTTQQVTVTINGANDFVVVAPAPLITSALPVQTPIVAPDIGSGQGDTGTPVSNAISGNGGTLGASSFGNSGGALLAVVTGGLGDTSPIGNSGTPVSSGLNTMQIGNTASGLGSGLGTGFGNSGLGSNGGFTGSSIGSGFGSGFSNNTGNGLGGGLNGDGLNDRDNSGGNNGGNLPSGFERDPKNDNLLNEEEEEDDDQVLRSTPNDTNFVVDIFSDLNGYSDNSSEFVASPMRSFSAQLMAASSTEKGEATLALALSQHQPPSKT